MMSDTIETEDEFYAQNEDVTYPLLQDSTIEKNIIWQPKDFTIRELCQMKTDGDLDLQPNYQREFVFDNTKSSRLIESILMDVPIPVIYFAEEKNGTYSVIDGQQRLTSFISFVEGKFPDGQEFKLSSLKVLSDLNKKKFSDLTKENQTKIRTTALHTIVIKKESNEDIKFEIFERLNTGSVKLNEDEIRNSIYRGKYINLLKELSEDNDFNFLVNKPNFKKRMIYRGMILRFLAISEKSYLNYKPSIKQFCNKELRENRNLSDEKANEYRERFKKCVELCKLTFGENAFQRYKMGDSNDPNGKWITSRLNMALFDIEMCGFVLFEKNQIISHLDEIRDGLIELQTENEEFVRSLEIQTSDREAVLKRFNIWLDFLQKIVSEKQRRNFSFDLKKKLYETDNTCKLCGNKILFIEDSEVDHIVPFSKGGATTENNAQIVHRFCNRKKLNNV